VRSAQAERKARSAPLRDAERIADVIEQRATPKAGYGEQGAVIPEA